MFKNETKPKKTRADISWNSTPLIEQNNCMRPGGVLAFPVRESSEYNQSQSDDEIPSELMGGRSIPKGVNNPSAAYCPRSPFDIPGPAPFSSQPHSPFFGQRTLFPGLERKMAYINRLLRQHPDSERKPDGTDHQFTPL